MKKLAIAVALFAGGILTGLAVAADKPGSDDALKTILENPRVAVHAVNLPAGARRPGRTRPTDELVLFCEEAHYQAHYADGRTEARNRAPGAVVWHEKGDVAPTLINNGGKPIHFYSISVK